MSDHAKPPLRAILFDLDDTLWPAHPLIADAEHAMLAWLSQDAPNVAALGRDFMRQRWHELSANHPHLRINLWALRMQVLREAFAAAGEPDENEVRIKTAMQVFVDARHQVSLYDDVLPVIQQMRQFWRLGVITNGIADINQIGIAEHFEVAISAHEFGNAKPDASIFHAACAKLGVAPQEALYVGDDLYFDVEGAQQAGLRAAWIKRDSNKAIDQRHSHITYETCCTDLHQLYQWLHLQGAAN